MRVKGVAEGSCSKRGLTDPLCAPVSIPHRSVTRMPSGYATAIRMLAKRAQDSGAKVGCRCWIVASF